MLKMKAVIDNNNKCELKNWFAMLYIHGRKFMIGSLFTYQRLSKDIKILALIFVSTKAVTDLKNSLYYPPHIKRASHIV